MKSKKNYTISNTVRLDTLNIGDKFYAVDMKTSKPQCLVLRSHPYFLANKCLGTLSGLYYEFRRTCLCVRDDGKFFGLKSNSLVVPIKYKEIY